MDTFFRIICRNCTREGPDIEIGLQYDEQLGELLEFECPCGNSFTYIPDWTKAVGENTN